MGRIVKSCKLSESEKAIIVSIVKIQLISLKFIVINYREAETELKKPLSKVDQNRFTKNITEIKGDFEFLSHNPEKVFSSNKHHSILRHILAHSEEELRVDNNQAVNSIWRKFFLFEEIINQNLN